jgi:hypothetical protein
MMEIEASDASNARELAVAKLVSMSEEIQGTRAKHAAL